jgi:hypothetical protein
MRDWLKNNFKTILYISFVIPIIVVAVVSISHVEQWYGISHTMGWALYLSIGIEVAALSALAALSGNMGNKVYLPFIIVTLLQLIGNIYFAFNFIDINSSTFNSWVDLVYPLFEFMNIDKVNLLAHKRILAFITGAPLPIISLSFLHLLVSFQNEKKIKPVITPTPSVTVSVDTVPSPSLFETNIPTPSENIKKN